jgi:hypothetical protein
LVNVNAADSFRLKDIREELLGLPGTELSLTTRA